MTIGSGKNSHQNAADWNAKQESKEPKLQHEENVDDENDGVKHIRLLVNV